MLFFVFAEPAAGFHVYAAVGQELHALGFELFALYIGAAENVALAQRAVFEHYAVAWRIYGVRVAVQHKAHTARGTRFARCKCHKAVICHLAARNLAHHLKHALGKIVHRIQLPLLSNRFVQYSIKVVFTKGFLLIIMKYNETKIETELLIWLLLK